jgi:hypothetical protein
LIESHKFRRIASSVFAQRSVDATKCALAILPIRMDAQVKPAHDRKRSSRRCENDEGNTSFAIRANELVQTVIQLE